MSLQEEVFRTICGRLSLLNIKPGTVEMTLGKGLANEQFFSNLDSLLATNNLQQLDSARCSPFDRQEMQNPAHSQGEFLFEQLRQFLLGVIHLPIVEIDSLLIVVVQHLAQNSLQPSWQRLDERWGTIGIVHITKIVKINVLPAGAEKFGMPSATFAESRITNLSVSIGQHDASGSPNGLFDERRNLTSDTLIALAMIVGTNIEELMVGVVPKLNNYLFTCPSSLIPNSSLCNRRNSISLVVLFCGTDLS